MAMEATEKVIAPRVPLKSRSLVEVCKAAGDPLRVDIMRVLSKDSFGVQELAYILDIPQPGMSHHLKILSKGGLLATRREGNSIFYRRATVKGDTALEAFQSSLYETIDKATLDDVYFKRMSFIHKERSQQSRAYFEKNFARFEEEQGMLCELKQYFSNIKEMIDLTALPPSSRVMEVGPGQGLLLEELARRFAHLVALDDSGEMLSLAKGKVASKNSKIEFVNSSLEAYRNKEGNLFDAVVLNMVLHHLSSPPRALHKLGQLVSPGGYILIADLCSHDQEWTKEKCGDVWLGFDPQELNDWAKQAGFKERQSSYLGLKNGFQIQLKLFVKNN